MTGTFTFKTVRNRRPYFAAPIWRRTTACRLHFGDLMGAIAAFDAHHGQRRIAA